MTPLDVILLACWAAAMFAAIYANVRWSRCLRSMRAMMEGEPRIAVFSNHYALIIETPTTTMAVELYPEDSDRLFTAGTNYVEVGVAAKDKLALEHLAAGIV